MQIDFHYAVAYVIARLVGFSIDDASIIAYASQYVDDATNSGKIQFKNGIWYSRISSAHKMIDPRNFNECANLMVWLPFHFLPGNRREEAQVPHEGAFIEKLVCTSDSYVARDMVDSCIEDVGKPYGLHRLGITMHTYADTFSHQGFAGVCHEINEVDDLDDNSNTDTLFEKVKTFISSTFIEKVMPLGHGAALSYPDIPYVSWSYKNEWYRRYRESEIVKRNNFEIFNDAAKGMFQAMALFYERKFGAPASTSITENDLERIYYNLRNFTEEEGYKRFNRWKASILNGEFSFAKSGDEEISYVPKGRGSWKCDALRTENEWDEPEDIFEYHDAFLTSNWKLFHDALQKHRFVVLRDILPNYGICGA